MATRLGKAIVELESALGDRPYVLVYDQAHKTQGRACIKGHFGGGYAASFGLASLAPEFVRQLCSGDEKHGDEAGAK